MKSSIKILVVEFTASVVLALFMNNATINYDFLTAVGLGNFVFGLFGVVIGVVAAIINNEIARPLLIASGLLLLMGCLTCSLFPINLNARVN